MSPAHLLCLAVVLNVLSVTDQHESIATIVARLKGGGDDASAAAQELYALTSFTAAVTIDTPAAYTAYDKLVFGGASVPDHHEAVEVFSSPLPSSLCPLKSSLAYCCACCASTVMRCPNIPAHFGPRCPIATLKQSLCCRHVDSLQETEWVDGKSYKMGDGFMTYTDEGAKADTRRVAVMHSKNATSNRIGIGMVSGVFDALTSAIASGTPDTRFETTARHKETKAHTLGCAQTLKPLTHSILSLFLPPLPRYHSLRALSQISFRNSDNKRRFGETEGGFQAVGLALDHACASGDAKLLAEVRRETVWCIQKLGGKGPER
jgi:hypothetical protein